MKLLIQRCMGCLKHFNISLPFEKEHQRKMGSHPCWLSLMLPIYHFTKWLTGQFLGAVTWPLGGEAGGSCCSSIHNHLLEKLFLLVSLCEVSLHLVIWLVCITTLCPHISFYSRFLSRKLTVLPASAAAITGLIFIYQIHVLYVLQSI